MPRAKPTRRAYVFAADTVSVREPGSKYPTIVHKGEVWHADCPMVQAHPALFSPDPPEVHPRGWSPPVEQATAAPGEKRDTGRAG
jgi:hypothetical protein